MSLEIEKNQEKMKRLIFLKKNFTTTIEAAVEEKRAERLVDSKISLRIYVSRAL